MGAMVERSDVLAAMGGDKAAFGRLYERYARPVYLALAARLGQRADTEDSLQATFLAAWEHLPGLRDPERFAAWLFRIARNKARDRHRRGAPKLLLMGGASELIAPERSQPRQQELGRLMAQLHPRTRAIVLLRVLEGWSAKEVARAEGISAATARRRYARALTHLRNALQARANHEEDKRRATH